jgi:anti-sigma factor RsiW
MHLDEETLQRWAHGELEPTRRRSADEHLAGCAECHARVEALKREEDELRTLFATLDHDPPSVPVSLVLAKASLPHEPSASDEELIPASPPRNAPSFWRRWKWGAGLLLGVGLGVAYAVPGSPLRQWMSNAVGVLADRSHRATEQTVRDLTPAPASSGLSVTPGDHFSIVFSSPQPASVAIITFADEGSIAVRARGAGAAFTSRAEGFLVDNTSAGEIDFDIVIPRGALHVEIRVRDGIAFVAERGRVITGPEAGADGSFTVLLGANGP